MHSLLMLPGPIIFLLGMFITKNTHTFVIVHTVYKLEVLLLSAISTKHDINAKKVMKI